MSGWWPWCCCCSCSVPADLLFVFNGNALSTPPAALSTVTESYDEGGGTWTTRSNLSARQMMASGSSPEAVYSVGGATNTSGTTRIADTEMFCKDSLSWITETVYPQYLTQDVGNAACGSENEIHVFGGTNNTPATQADSRKLTCNASSWSSLASLPATRTGVSSSSPGNGYEYAIAGWNSSASPTTTNYQYDVSGNSFATKTATPTPAREGAGSITDYSDAVSLTGGLASGAVKDTHTLYSEAGDSWSTKATLGTGRWNGRGSSSASKGYMYCGASAVTPVFESSAEKYDFGGDSWSGIAATGAPRRQIGAGS